MSRTDREYEGDHVEAGWSDDHSSRWIEAGQLRLEEDDKGAIALVQNPRRANECWLSAAELAGLAQQLGLWFADDPADALREIEARATRVLTVLEKWNDRARRDEEHPPYDDLTRDLGSLLGTCRDLREILGRFTGPKTVTVDGAEEGTR